jgi:hypothetical protein
VIIVEKRDIKNLFVLPSSRNKSNSDYHGKIYQHLPLPLNSSFFRIKLQRKKKNIMYVNGDYVIVIVSI